VLALSCCSITQWGCSECEYTIKADYIESTCKFRQGFYFQEINVITSDSQGIPVDIEVIRTISLSHNIHESNSNHRIYFYRDNDNYKWNDTQNYSLSSKLPFEMKVGEWYKIRGLVFRGNPDRGAYIQLQNNGQLRVHGFSESTNW
jgi:hypothetical protein